MKLTKIEIYTLYKLLNNHLNEVSEFSIDRRIEAVKYLDALAKLERKLEKEIQI